MVLASNDFSPVTEKLDKGAVALVFDKMLTNVTGSLDLWNYAECDLLQPIRFKTWSKSDYVCRFENNKKARNMNIRFWFCWLIAL